jgi:hypothetical protein
MKNEPKHGHSTRNGNSPSPYQKYDKKPYGYSGEVRLANGDLKVKANDTLKNRYG